MCVITLLLWCLCVRDSVSYYQSFTFPALAAQQISQKKLKKFEKEYHTIREQQEQQEAPIERYEVHEHRRRKTSLASK